MNVLSVTGRLTSDPARRDTTNGVVCEFRLAVDGQRRLWLPVVTWGKLAGTCKRHLHTGRRVAVSGQLCVDEFLAAQGELRRRWFLRAEHVTFLDAPRRPGWLHIRRPTAVTTRPRRCPVQTVEWVFRHAGNCLIEVPPLELPTAARPVDAGAWVATLWPDATSHNGWSALAWSKADRGWEIPRHLAVGDVLEFGLAAVNAADGTTVAGCELRWYGWLAYSTDSPWSSRVPTRTPRRPLTAAAATVASAAARAAPRLPASIPAGCPTSSATTSSRNDDRRRDRVLSTVT